MRITRAVRFVSADFEKAGKFTDPTQCLLAQALKRTFPEVYQFWIGNLLKEAHYTKSQMSTELPQSIGVVPGSIVKYVHEAYSMYGSDKYPIMPEPFHSPEWKITLEVGLFSYLKHRFITKRRNKQ